MTSTWRMARALAGGLALALVAAACGGDDGGDNAGGGGNLTGSVNVSGSSTVLPISELVGETFNQENPDVSVRIDGPGTGDGFELFCEGTTDINDASRPIEDEESTACEDGGINYVALEIAFDGITVMVNPANNIDCLTTGDLYALFGPESQGFDTWADANSLASAVGGTGGFPNAPLEITAPGEESGTYDAFIDLAGIEDTALEQGVSEDDAAALRKDYQASPDDNVIIQAIEGSENAVGFVGFAYAQGAGSGVKEVAIDAGDGCVSPSAETIADGSYPLSRSLFIYPNTDKVAQNDALKAFVDLYVSDTGLSEAVTAAGYIPLPADRVSATRDAWEGVVGA